MYFCLDILQQCQCSYKKTCVFILTFINNVNVLIKEICMYFCLDIIQQCQCSYKKHLVFCLDILQQCQCSYKKHVFTSHKELSNDDNKLKNQSTLICHQHQKCIINNKYMKP